MDSKPPALEDMNSHANDDIDEAISTYNHYLPRKSAPPGDVFEVELPFGNEIPIDSCNQRKYADLVLVVVDTGRQEDVQNFYGHKHVLAHRCTYFQYRLDKEDVSNEMVVGGVRACIFRPIFWYLYTNKYELPQIELVFEVIRAARLFQLWDLVNLVFGQVGDLLTTSNILRIFQDGFGNNCPEVLFVCTEFVINNFQELEAGENGEWEDQWTGQINEALKPETVGVILEMAIKVGWKDVISFCTDYIVINFKTVASNVNNLRAISKEVLVDINVQYAKSI